MSGAIDTLVGIGTYVDAEPCLNGKHTRFFVDMCLLLGDCMFFSAAFSSGVDFPLNIFVGKLAFRKRAQVRFWRKDL